MRRQGIGSFVDQALEAEAVQNLLAEAAQLQARLPSSNSLSPHFSWSAFPLCCLYGAASRSYLRGGF